MTRILYDNRGRAVEAEINLGKTLEKFQQTAELAQIERRAFMATQPRTVPCLQHPDYLREIDEELTNRRTREAGGEFTAGYLPCARCRHDEERTRFLSYGVPDNLLDATFETFTPDDAASAGHVDTVKAFCRKACGFLILTGVYGTGKSHLAAAALRSFGQGWFIKQSSLLYSLRATYRDKAAVDPIERAKGARFLVLDDAGLSAGGKDEVPMLHEVLDHRHNKKLPTIITSNLDYEELAEAFGPRMADRFRQSIFRILNFTGNSHRRNSRDGYFVEDQECF